MKVLELLTESVSLDSAVMNFKSLVGDYLQTQHKIRQTIEDKTAEGDPRTGRRLAGLAKARWVSENYFSSKRFRNTGIQPAARALSRLSKKEASKKLFFGLANIRMSAQKGSGRAEVFDIIGDYLIDLSNLATDPNTKALLQRVSQARDAIERASTPPEPTSEPKAKKEKPKRDSLAGVQNAQAEAAFQAVLATLPKDVAKKVRQDTQRMSPSDKMSWLQRNQQLLQ